MKSLHTAFSFAPPSILSLTICDTWQILANTVYPGGLSELQKKSQNRYSEIGKAKCEWADKIGVNLVLEENISPSFRFFINELEMRIASE